MYSITKSFEKSIFPKCLEELFIAIIRQKRHIVSWRENSTFSAGGKREKTHDELCVHTQYEKMSGQTQNSVIVKAPGYWQRDNVVNLLKWC